MKTKTKRKPGHAAHVGTVHPEKTLFLRTYAGEATSGSKKYEIATSMVGTPMIQSCQTGRFFTLSWQEILELGLKAGLDNAD